MLALTSIISGNSTPALAFSTGAADSPRIPPRAAFSTVLRTAPAARHLAAGLQAGPFRHATDAQLPEQLPAPSPGTAAPSSQQLQTATRARTAAVGPGSPSKLQARRAKGSLASLLSLPHDRRSHTRTARGCSRPRRSATARRSPRRARITATPWRPRSPAACDTRTASKPLFAAPRSRGDQPRAGGGAPPALLPLPRPPQAARKGHPEAWGEPRFQAPRGRLPGRFRPAAARPGSCPPVLFAVRRPPSPTSSPSRPRRSRRRGRAPGPATGAHPRAASPRSGVPRADPQLRRQRRPLSHTRSRPRSLLPAPRSGPGPRPQLPARWRRRRRRPGGGSPRDPDGADRPAEAPRPATRAPSAAVTCEHPDADLVIVVR